VGVTGSSIKIRRRMIGHPTKYLPAYDAGDHLHPNEAGLQAIANSVDLNLFAPGASTPVISLKAHANGQW